MRRTRNVLAGTCRNVQPGTCRNGRARNLTGEGAADCGCAGVAAARVTHTMISCTSIGIWFCGMLAEEQRAEL